MEKAGPVWLISGCSVGLGRAIANHVLAHGGRVVATARDPGTLSDLVADHTDRVLALALDVTQSAQIDVVVSRAIERFGCIDVLVNNAGYGYQSSVEEGEDVQIRRQFEVNVFGPFALTRAVLPHLRAQRSGHIVNVTSIAGLIGLPGSGYYAASKHAVEGWSDALTEECRPLGIGVTCVEPGPFRTNWAGRSLVQTPCAIPDYANTVGARLRSTQRADGRQSGDPARAAAAILAVTQTADPPRHLVLGRAGIEMVLQSSDRRRAQIDAWRQVGEGTDFPAAE